MTIETVILIEQLVILVNNAGRTSISVPETGLIVEYAYKIKFHNEIPFVSKFAKI